LQLFTGDVFYAEDLYTDWGQREELDFYRQTTS
jgi:hypothetical protein